MLKQEYRLAKRSDIERVFKRGKSFFVGNLSIRVSKNELQTTRFAIVVSTKVSKKAVRRNKLKRRIREVLRTEVIKRMQHGYDCVIVTQKGSIDKSYEDLAKLVVGACKKAKLLS